jgi:hypothetical protein
VPHTDIDQKKAYQREYRRKKRLCPVFREEMKRIARRYHKANTESVKEAVVNVLTNGEGTCRWCGQGDLDVLCVDHIANNGRQHAAEHGYRGGHYLYKWIIKNEYPEGFQILCYNCNAKKEAIRRKQVMAAKYALPEYL